MVRSSDTANSLARETAAPISRLRIVLVTGMSGAGKSSVLKALEDIGYEAVDNLPFSLLPNLIEVIDDNPDHRRPRSLAIGIDSRTRAFRAERFESRTATLKANDNLDVSLVFCDCSDEILHHRFTETRRRHPLAGDRPLIEGIERERQTMNRLRERADYVFDTTDLTIADLRRVVRGHFELEGDASLTLSVVSFSYRRGLPREADLVFDVRFLANPHYVDKLRDGTGKDSEVGAFIAADPFYQQFLDQTRSMILSLLPRYQDEGKSYLTIAFGCTGGRHRSVYLAEQISVILADAGYKVQIVHRELDRK
ncbi:MAG: RNase adapter RapZ [Sphingomonadales bacterium]